MNENHERGTLHYKFLTTIAIVALLIGSNTALAIGTNSEGLSEVAKQLQSQVINGTVTDQTGEPVIGASVLEKGTNNGIITNIDGKFSLTVKRGATLVISFVGYKTLEVKATPKMEITLTEDSELLEEVVVVGYGVQKKKLVTGATVQVKGTDIAKLNTTDVLNTIVTIVSNLKVTCFALLGSDENNAIGGT